MNFPWSHAQFIYMLVGISLPLGSGSICALAIACSLWSWAWSMARCRVWMIWWAMVDGSCGYVLLRRRFVIVLVEEWVFGPFGQWPYCPLVMVVFKCLEWVWICPFVVARFYLFVDVRDSHGFGTVDLVLYEFLIRSLYFTSPSSSICA